MTGSASRVPLVPDVILPVQFLPAAVATPEKRLLLAVLEEAVGTYQRHAMATDRRSRAEFVEVEAWFASEGTAWLYSFVAICEAIGLDATYVRLGLQQWTDTHRATSLETVRSPYRFPFSRVGGARHRATGQPQSAPRGRGVPAPRPVRESASGSVRARDREGRSERA